MSPAVILRTDENKEAAIRRIRSIRPDQDKPLAVYIDEYRKIRSLEANARYWSRIGLICAATGHSKDTLHQYFKRRAFGVRIEQVGTEMVEVVPSSARVSRGDFSELQNLVDEFIVEFNIEEAA